MYIYTDIDAHIRACMNIDKRYLTAVFEDNVYIGSIEQVILDEKCKVERRPLHFADILRKEWQKKSWVDCKCIRVYSRCGLLSDCTLWPGRNVIPWHSPHSPQTVWQNIIFPPCRNMEHGQAQVLFAQTTCRFPMTRMKSRQHLTSFASASLKLQLLACSRTG